MATNDDQPTLAQVHADLVSRSKLDERVRSVEISQARTDEAIADMRGIVNDLKAKDLPAMEQRLGDKIDRGHVNIWPIVMGICAVVALAITISGVAAGNIN